MLWIRNGLFRIRIQPGIFRVPDPDPSKISGSNPFYFIIFGNFKQNHLKFNYKEESINYLPFAISYYSTQSPEFTDKLHFYLSALSYLAGSMRIRIHNTDINLHLLPISLHFFLFSVEKISFLDPDSERKINLDPCGSGSLALLNIHTVIRYERDITYVWVRVLSSVAEPVR